MSIATAIQAAQQKVASAYTSVQTMGGTLPATQNLSNLPSAIESIPVGGGDKYGLSLDSVLGNTNSSGRLQDPGQASTIDLSGVSSFNNRAFNLSDNTATTSSTSLKRGFFSKMNIVDFKMNDVVNATSGSNEYAFQEAFYKSTSIKNFSANKLEVLASAGMFEAACASSSLESYDFSSLRWVKADYVFRLFLYGTTCFSLDFKNLLCISGANPFNDFLPLMTDNSIPKIDLRRLYSIAGLSTFQSCFGGDVTLPLYSLELPSVIQIQPNSSASYATFAYGRRINKVYLPKIMKFYINASSSYTHIFDGCVSTSEFHFGKKNKSFIEADPGYSTLWGRGAGAATVYFDLINEIVCNGVRYYRNAPDDDEENQKYCWCSGGVITVNGVDYERSPSDDLSDPSTASWPIPFAWKQVGGTSKRYTGNVNPIVGEGVNSSTSGVYSETSQVSNKRGMSFIYTDSKYTPSVGDNCFIKSGSSYTVAGQITETT